MTIRCRKVGRNGLVVQFLSFDCSESRLIFGFSLVMMQMFVDAHGISSSILVAVSASLLKCLAPSPQCFHRVPSHY